MHPIPHILMKTPPSGCAPDAPFEIALRVLIADSYPDTAWTLAAALRLFGVEARHVGDGLEALRAAGDFRPDAVLMDLKLSGLDGCEVARRLRGSPGADGLLLVAVTVYHDEAHRARAREAGFDYYLVKPACPEALYRLLLLATRSGPGASAGAS